MIKFIYSIYFGVKDVFSHKLRATLSILGVVFGIAAVISIVSISEGAKRDVINKIRLLGIDNMSIVSSASDKAKRAVPLLYKDYEIVAKLDFVKKASPMKIVSASVIHKAKLIQSEIFGVNEAYLEIMSLPMESGRFFGADDVSAINNVCVIGAFVKEALFGLDNAVGNLIKIKNDWYTVIGVIGERHIDGKIGTINVKNIDGAVLLPISSLYKTYFTLFEKPINEIVLTAQSNYDKQSASEEISEKLMDSGKEKRFDLIIPSELIAQSYETQRIFNVVLGAIAAISLIVGGIGIMNIMLASVTERTREIGIRRAIGAKKSDIMLQFILESLVLTSLGGIIGILLGITGASFINFKIGWTVYISPAGVIFSLMTASITGMIFGIYPAMKASRLNPIEALRYE